MDKTIDKLIDTYCCKKKARPPNRVVYVDNQLPSHTEVVSSDDLQLAKYPSNKIISSKYTAWNFLPKNLFEQFRRVANFYFLCVGTLSFIIDSPVSPMTSLLPLVFVVFVTAIKQGYEDWLRHKSDNEVNKRKVYVVRGGERLKVDAKDIQVGDVVRVVSNEPIPCDMVMLSSHDDEGSCYITTANLDGETNLKTFSCPCDTRHLQTDESFKDFRATIICEQSTTDLYNFVGNIEVSAPAASTERETTALSNGTVPDSNGAVGGSNGAIPSMVGSDAAPIITTTPLTAQNVLLRGSRLKNTPYVYGCAIYTGRETKISMNSQLKSYKFSRVEGSMNRYLIFFLIFLVVESAVLAALKIVYYEQEENTTKYVWYTLPENDLDFLMVLTEFLSYMVLMNYIIPISMYVTVELQKFFGSMFFQWDADMYDAQLNEPAIANTSDLNEELGQIDYLFTDKTGTLTENDMQFRQCAVADQQYIEVGGKLCEKPTIPGVQPVPIDNLTSELYDLYTVMSLCHTVHVEHTASQATGTYSITGHEYEYQASSPDEKALVEACRRQGIVYHGTKDRFVEVGFGDDIKRFTVHQTLEFDPTRKRMSVLVEDQNGDFYLMCKGAETALLDRATNNNTDMIEKHVVDYAKLGLRTLVLAQRKLSSSEFLTLSKVLDGARKSLEDRQEKLSEAYSEVEKDLTLLGVTAVEDRLQEGVADTIQSLRLAGIQVWVLTGDKEETAVNISYSAGHFYPGVEELRLTRIRSQEECAQRIKHLVDILKTSNDYGAPKYALIIDGVSLVYVLHNHQQDIIHVCRKVSTVLCCRMSPLQKAQVVKLMKDDPRQPTTAAVGDGANDVSMIQEAHVGLGIMGKEGRQAVRASDYAFGRFKFLKRAILVHGHYFYIRIATLVQYFFYKNIAFITAQLYYAFFSAYSTQSVYDTFCLMLYNITFTSLPILIYGLFEQNIPQKQLLRDPTLYKRISKNSWLSMKEFARWNLTGLWHSLVTFFGCYFYLSHTSGTTADGQTHDSVYDFGLTIYTAVIFVVNCKLALEWYHWNAPAVISFIITALGYMLLLTIYNFLKWSLLVEIYSMVGLPETMFTSLYIYILLPVLIVAALIPDIITRSVRDQFTTVYKRQQYKKLQRKKKRMKDVNSNMGFPNPMTDPVVCLRASTSSSLNVLVPDDSISMGSYTPSPSPMGSPPLSPGQSVFMTPTSRINNLPVSAL